MKKFTKITLIIAAVFLIVGLTLCTTAISVSGGINELRRMAQSGQLNFGNWHFEDGFYYKGEDMFDFVETMDIDIDIEPAGKESTNVTHREEIRCIEMYLDLASVEIKATDDEEISVAMTGGYKKYYDEKVTGNTLKIMYEVGSKNFKEGPEITIRVPKDYVLENLVIDTDLGNIRVLNLVQGIGNLQIEADLGNIEVDNCTIVDKAYLEANMGNAAMTNVTCKDAELKSDMGAVSFDGRVLGDLTMKADMGSATATIDGKESDYNIELSASMGEVTCGGHKHHDDMGGKYRMKYEGAERTIYMHSAMGEVELSFR